MYEGIGRSLGTDYFRIGDQLTREELDYWRRTRDFVDDEVLPVINGYWERAEFPTQFVKPLADLGVLSYAWDETAPFENSAVFRGFVAMELARVDASIATFVGVQNGLVTGTLSLCGSDEQRAEWIPKLASGEVIGAFGLTEPLSGSDSARGLRTTATRDGDEWVLTGAKRCSSRCRSRVRRARR